MRRTGRASGTNQNFVKFLQEHKVPVTFETGAGAHEWDFWDRYILRAIDWLPTSLTDSGIDSGHVSAK